ncbi:protein of unknown function [Candidatus Methylomirabilis oxygeniifera]|uniref:Uncharacterized protein n=1 Tax=Methylomirabilis oxygeniifera TaxID=671143 RepID=D5MJD5_METO1|nr:protein of unknown function [Candidatus Methylomirabilis oxyfera]
MRTRHRVSLANTCGSVSPFFGLTGRNEDFILKLWRIQATDRNVRCEFPGQACGVMAVSVQARQSTTA